jgi:hypothetical protein
MSIPIDESSEGVLGVIFRDLKPLRDEYPDGTAEVPEDLMQLVATQDLDDDPRVVGWRFTVREDIRQRGVPAAEVFLEVNGVTIVFGPPDADDNELVLRRYVDWADVWAQLGVSSGRGELDPDQDVLDPANLPLAEQNQG